MARFAIVVPLHRIHNPHRHGLRVALLDHRLDVFNPEQVARVLFELLDMKIRASVEAGCPLKCLTLLGRHFAERLSQELGLPAFAGFSAAVQQQLLGHSWPGNVRELANVAERRVLGLGEPQWDDPDIGQSLVAQQEAFEAQCLRAALTRHKGDIKAVLNELQLPRRTLNEKMQRHGLVRDTFL